MNSNIKAVGLLSGGLDSMLAAALVKNQGIEVLGMFFSMPWGCGDEERVKKIAEIIGIKLVLFRLDEDYLEIVKNPLHGRGAALNPCIDCKIYMLKKANKYMSEIKADFVFTGEVIGQRPMSQLKHSLRAIEKRSQLEGKLLRPLSAKLFPPTIAEENKWIDREKLLNISGRSRKEQFALAKQFAISGFTQPAGGCLLTDKNFSNRLKDLWKHGFRDLNDITSLRWGRHFRLADKHKAIVGRDEKENDLLLKYANPDDIILDLPGDIGPTVVITGNGPDERTIALAAGLAKRFSKKRGQNDLEAEYRKKSDLNKIYTVNVQSIEESLINKLKL
ncbi:MAG: hypothetical protein HQL27_08175 [Candidatus Omnitrophica bacterium]|nr:hypothetical protein [Candidatus Omnitrophota bacterium]